MRDQPRPFWRASDLEAARLRNRYRLDSCVCGHKRAAHSYDEGNGCTVWGCRCANYAWDRVERDRPGGGRG